MANGVGTPRIIKGQKYYPIYEHYGGRKIVNTMVKADTEAEARRILKDRVAEYHKQPTADTVKGASVSVAMEELRKDVVDLPAQKTRNLYINVFNRLFVDFPKTEHLTLAGCSDLPKGYFKRYKSYSDSLKRNWRAEIIYVKAIMKRLTDLGYATEADLKQARSLPTPEGSPRLMPKHTDKQIADLLAYIKKDRPDFYKPLKFMALVGRRPGETCAIAKEDVSGSAFDPIAIQTKPITAKNKKRLPPPIYLKDAELKDLIKSALANNATPWLFPHRNGGQIDPNYLWKYLVKTSIQVIGIRIYPYVFDKRFATMAHRGGVNKDAMAMANRKNVSVIIKHYVESTPTGQANVIEANRKGMYNDEN